MTLQGLETQCCPSASSPCPSHKLTLPSRPPCLWVGPVSVSFGLSQRTCHAESLAKTLEEYRTTTQVTQLPLPTLGGSLPGLALLTSLLPSPRFTASFCLCQSFPNSAHLTSSISTVCVCVSPLSVSPCLFTFSPFPSHSVCLCFPFTYILSGSVSSHCVSPPYLSVSLPGSFTFLPQSLSGSDLPPRTTPFSVPGLYESCTSRVSCLCANLCLLSLFRVSIAAFFFQIFLAGRLPSGFLLLSVSLWLPKFVSLRSSPCLLAICVWRSPKKSGVELTLEKEPRAGG